MGKKKRDKMRGQQVTLAVVDEVTDTGRPVYRRAIPRCAKCIKGGKTNTNVVALATSKTRDAIDGDFLCIFHNDATARPLPEHVRAEQN